MRRTFCSYAKADDKKSGEDYDSICSQERIRKTDTQILVQYHGYDVCSARRRLAFHYESFTKSYKQWSHDGSEDKV